MDGKAPSLNVLLYTVNFDRILTQKGAKRSVKMYLQTSAQVFFFKNILLQIKLTVKNSFITYVCYALDVFVERYCMSNFQFVQKYHGLSVRSLFPGHDNGQEAFISTKQLNQGIIDLHCYMAFNGGNLCTKLFMLPLDFIISVIKVMSHGCTFTPKSKGHQNPKIAIYRTTSFSATSYY